MRRRLSATLALMLASASMVSSARPVQVTDVYVVVKSHFDLGFTDLTGSVFHRYRTEMMDGSLEIIERNRSLPKDQQFVWTMPGWPLMSQILGPEQTPGRREQIEKAVRDGALTANALPFTLHTESLDHEDLVRGIGFSSAAARKHGHPLPLAARMSDVPSNSWVIPPLLAHAGITFMNMGCNPASQYDSYENSLLHGEDTWGMNAEYGPRTRYGWDWKGIHLKAYAPASFVLE